MTDNRDDIFWEAIDGLREARMLNNVMIIGAWAMRLYRLYFNDGLLALSRRTHDIDILVRNPFLEVDGSVSLGCALRKRQFVPDGLSVMCQKMYKDGFELEFLTPSYFGANDIIVSHAEICAQRLDHTGMLRPMILEINGYTLTVPTPASFATHKLYISPFRKTERKRESDIDDVRSVLAFMQNRSEDLGDLRALLVSLPEEERSQILEVATQYGIGLPTE